MTLIDNDSHSLNQWMQESLSGAELRIATGFFSINGLVSLLALLPSETSLRLVAAKEIKTGEETLEDYLTGEAKKDTNDLRELYETLGKRVSVRVHKNLHAKLYLRQDTGVLGSSNLTQGGLEDNLELNIELSQQEFEKASEWFEDVWEESDKFTGELTKILERSPIGRELVEVPVKEPGKLRRAYRIFGDEVLAKLSGKALPTQLACLDAWLPLAPEGNQMKFVDSSLYDYYQDLLKEAARRRATPPGFEQFYESRPTNPRWWWEKDRRSGNPVSVPIEPDGELWLLESYLKQDGSVSIPSDEHLTDRRSGPVLMVDLWDNQEQALKEWIGKGRDGIVEMATATGKTVVGLAAIAELCGVLPGFGKLRTENADILIVAHQQPLITQWRNEIETKLALKRHSSSLTGRQRKLKFDTGTIEIQTPGYIAQNASEFENRVYDLVIYDEVHHYSQPEGWGASFEQISRKATLGLSATVDDSERRMLEEQLGEVVSEYGLEMAQKNSIIPAFEWVLHPVEFTSTEQERVTQLNKQISRTVDEVQQDPQTAELFEEFDLQLDRSDFLPVFLQAHELAKRFEGEDEIPDSWRNLLTLLLKKREEVYTSEQAQSKAVELAHSYIKEGLKVIIFTMRVETAESIADTLPNTWLIHGDLPEEDKSDRITRFKEEGEGALVAARMLDEGIDVPDAEIGINVAGTKTRLQLVQRIGRILRRGGEIKPVFHHFALDDELEFYREIGPGEPTVIEDPEPRIEPKIPFKIGTVKIGEILDSLSSKDAQQLLETDERRDTQNQETWWLGILREEYPEQFTEILRKKAKNG